MRILLLADLHYRKPWFNWLATQKVDLVLIAGDLLDSMTSGDSLIRQILYVRNWCAGYPGPLVLSSGNHDSNTQRGFIDPEELEELSAKQCAAVAQLLEAPHWMDCLARPGVMTDGRSECLSMPGGEVVVTTIPYDYGWEDDVRRDDLWVQGAKLQRAKRVPWIVLHHEPPDGTYVGGERGDLTLSWKIREYCPNFVVSGHLHEQPYRGSFAEKIDDTWCFNPGHPTASLAAKAPFPNHIILDLKARTATWYATPSTGKSPITKKIRLT